MNLFVSKYQKLINFVLLLLFFAIQNIHSQSVTVFREVFPTTFNTGYSGNLNTTFTGNFGTWSVSSNQSYASVAVVSTASFSSPNSLVLRNNSGAAASSASATSPSFNLSAYSACNTGGNLTFRIDATKLNSNNHSTVYYVDFSSNGGSTWTNVTTITAGNLRSTYPTAWSLATINIPASFITNNFRFKFSATNPASSGYNNDLFFDNVEVQVNACAATPTCSVSGQTNPLAAAMGYNVFARNNTTFQNGHSDGAVAMGGNLILNGSFTTGMANSGYLPAGFNSTANIALLIGGSVTYTSGGVSYVNSGLIRIGNTTGTNLYYKDCNNANSNLRLVRNQSSTCAVEYSSTPRIESYTQHVEPSPTFATGLNFTDAFTTLQTEANKLSNYTSNSTCASSLNIIQETAGNNVITLAPNKINVINTTGAELNAITQFTFNNNPSATQPLIINVNQPGNFTWNAQTYAGLQTAASKFIIFNFYNNTGTVTLSGNASIYGSILVPGGSFVKNHNGNIEGQIVAQNITLNGGEVHEQRFEVCLPSCTIQSGPSCVGNLLTNPGFENSSNFLTGWDNWGNTNATSDAYSGTRAAKVFNGSGGFAQSVSGTVGNIYTVRAFAKQTNGSEWSGIGIKYYNSSWGAISETNVQITTTTYQQYTVTSTAPSGTAFVQVYLWKNSGSAFVYADEFCLTVAEASCNANDPNAGSGYCAPSSNCLQSSNLIWSQTIAKGDGTPSTVRLWCGSTTSYTIPASFYPTILTAGGAVTVNINDVVSYDGYSSRNTVSQPNERWRIVFRKGGVTVATTSYTNDVPDNVRQGYWQGSLGTVNLPNGADEIRIEHWSVANDASCSNGPNSVVPVSVCMTVTAANNLRVGNLVWYDRNNNGVLDNGEPGISGATVRLYLDANNDNVPDGAAIATTTTNASGNYTFTGLSPNNYIVGVVIPTGYTQVTTNGGDPDNNIDNDNNGVNLVSGEIRSLAVTLSPGAEPTNDGDDANGNLTVDFALRGTGSIGDFVWHDINGNGIQDAGEPGIQGVTVTLTYPDASQVTTTTNSAGAYLFSNLIPGTYTVTFTTPSGYNTSPANVGADDNIDSDAVNGSVTVTLTTGQNNLTVDAGFVNCVKGTETFPNTYNTGFSKPISNGTFNGSSGTWNVNTSTTATIVVTTPYYSPSTSYAIKIVNWATNGSMPEAPTPAVGTTVVSSPRVDLSSPCCPAELKLQFTLWTYVVNGSDTNTDWFIEYSNDNGTTWNQIYKATPAAIAAAYGANAKVNLSFGIPAMYHNANFRYRFRTNKPINNPHNFYMFIDDIIIQSPATCAPTLSIGDFVWYDVNNNGLQDAGEPGINGATVNLYYDVDGDNIPDGAPIATTTTNASGAYNFANLGNGKYVVAVVTPNGYTQGTTTATSADPNNATTNDNNGVAVFNTNEIRTNSINLTANNPRVDFGFRGIMNLGNLVWFDANGNGLRDAAEPTLAGITVNLYTDNNTDNTPDGAAIATTTTNASGIYGFSNLAPGNYIVGVVLPTGYQNSFTPASGINPNTDTDNDNNGVNTVGSEVRSNFITLAAGTEPTNDGDGNNGNLTLDFGLRGILNLGNLVWVDLNNNGAREFSEPTLSGINVNLYYDANGDNLPDGAAIATTTTNASGNYGFNNLIPGNYIVGVQLPANYVGSATTGTSANPNNDVDNDNNGVTTVSGELRTNFITLSVGGEPTNDGDGSNGNLTLDLAIRPTQYIGDYVWYDINGNGIQDAPSSGEIGVPGIRVELYNTSNVLLQTTYTNQNGFYFFAVPTGTYYVKFTGIPTGLTLTTQGAGTPSTDSDPNPTTGNTSNFTITSGVNNTTIDAGLKSPTGVGNFVWVDTNGNGRQDSGEPGVPGIFVGLYNTSNQLVGAAITDNNGNYFINTVPGTYYLKVNVPSGYTLTTQNASGVPADLNSDANVTTGQTNNFTLTSTIDNTWDFGFVLKPNTVVSCGQIPLQTTEVSSNIVLNKFVPTGLGSLTNVAVDYNALTLNPFVGVENAAVGSQTFTINNVSNATLTLPNASNLVINNGFTVGSTTLATFDGAIDYQGASGWNLVNNIRANSATSNPYTPTSDFLWTSGPTTINLPFSTFNSASFNITGGNGNFVITTLASAGACVSYTYAAVNLGDFVWYDVNNNGIQDAGEPGISGATVNLYVDANADNVPDGAAIATTTTNASGIYSFNGLTPNNYIVGVVLPTGYTQGTTTASSTNPNNDINTDNNGVNLVGGEVRSNFITLTVGGEPTNDGDGSNGNLTLDFGLRGILNLGNFVWYDVNNNGIQDAGESGVSGATVNLYVDANGDNIPDGAAIATTTTNASGIYGFANLPPGNYIVGVVLPSGYAQGATTGTSANPNNDNLTDNNGVNLVGGEVRSNFITLTVGGEPTNDGDGSNGNLTLDFGLRGVMNLGNLVWFDANGNGLKDAAETGISGLTVSLYVDANGDNVPDGPAILTTTTNASGIYGFSNLVPNNYIVGVTMPSGYVAAPTTGTSANPNNDTDNDNNGVNTVGSELRSNFITLTVGGEPTNDGDGSNGNLTLDFALRGVLNLGDLVYVEKCNYGTKDAAELGFSGATVNLYEDKNGDNLPDGAAIATTTTNASGIYGFSNLIPGNYIVGVVLPNRYAAGVTITSSSNPNNDINHDNNGIRVASGIYFSNFITLTVGGEPTNDGDGSNGNLTLDFGIAYDTDSDGIADIIDIDDDNDGITDVNEHGGFDPFGDCDNDCVPNYLDPTPGPGCPPWSDCNSDGINDFYDWDRDGIINSLDLDSDNDGIPDAVEARPNRVAFTSIANGMITGTDADGNGLLSSADNGSGFTNPQLNGLIPSDIDRDGTPNFLDLDSDGDGITDLTEGLGVYSTTGVVTGTDTDGDGVAAENFGSSANNVADNVNGFGARGIVLLDTDGDGYPDAYDIDSDNDGITDNAEGQATCSNVLPLGSDCDGDGVDDNYDPNRCNACLRTSGGITPFDKDGDGTPDYRDLDTDNDGAPDIYEGHRINGATPPVNYWTGAVGDADKDGLIDFFDAFNIVSATNNFHRNVVNNNMGDFGVWDTGTGPVGSITQLPKSRVPIEVCTNGDRDWRDLTILPSTIIAFKGNLNGTTVKLSWSVTNEVNVKQYEVERSINGNSFIKVSTVNATNTPGILNYAAEDVITNINAPVLYYRLKVVDRNGSSSYSNTIAFKVDNNKPTIVIAPNPANSYFTVKITADKEADAVIKVVDITGRTIVTQKTTVLQGVNTISFNNLSNFSAGTYMVHVITNQNITTEKLVITK
jgi:protocatechuate 3,4-dioxygenase beta subunit